MIKNSRPRIYSKFEINSILFYATMILFIPLVLVFTYTLNIEYSFDIKVFLLYLLGITALLTIIGVTIIILKRDKMKRHVKATYIQEFYYLVIISIFGVLGIIVLYNYLQGPQNYIANIFVILLVLFVFILLRLGRKYFNLKYTKKK
ncbi:MAG: hypothetical protein RBQ64_01280 [Candidatus Izemoplasmatales bacterium]|jgi:hypothetical protein|nr:hypothetical protein [Candidatus Izemoplasmatales bacterium]